MAVKSGDIDPILIEIGSSVITHPCDLAAAAMKNARGCPPDVPVTLHDRGGAAHRNIQALECALDEMHHTPPRCFPTTRRPTSRHRLSRHNLGYCVAPMH